MRRQRLLFLFTICAILVTMAILGSASWMIVRSNAAEPTYPVNPDTSPCFSTSTIFSGKYQKPKLSDVGALVYTSNGEDYPDVTDDPSATHGYVVEWVGGKNASNNTIVDENFAGIIAGKHYYKITDVATGQVICENHELVIEQDTFVEISSTASGYYFEGGKVTWTVTLEGLNSGATHTFTHTLTSIPYNTYSYNSATGSIEYSKTISGENLRSNTSTTDGSYNDFTIPNINSSNYAGFNYNNFTFNQTYSLTYNILPTCYNSAGNYFGNLTAAIEGTSSGTLTAMPSITHDGDTYTVAGGNYSHVIFESCTIPNGVTLSIPYNESVTDIIVHDSTIKSPIFNNSKYELNYVTISENVTLTNNGTINIPAVISGGKGGVISSFVGGNYSRIYMDDNSTISSTGTINCYGYITESTENNGSHVNVTAGIINTVFTVQENRGGSTFMGMANPSAGDLYSCVLWGSTYEPSLTTFPFNRFFVHSVTSKMTIYSNATLNVHTSLYANNQDNYADMVLIGATSSALIQLGSDSRVECKFQVDDTSTTSTDERKHTLDIYGDIEINSLSFLLTITKGNYRIKISLGSEGTFFPISHHLDIRLHCLESSSSATVDSSLQDLKILPGGSLTIDSGVTLNIGQLAVYDSNTTLNVMSVTSSDYTPRNSIDGPAYTVTTPGVLMVNGTLNATNLGGTVQAGLSGATLNVTGSNSVYSQELINTYATVMDLYVTTQSYNASIYSSGTDATFTLNGVSATKSASGTVVSSDSNTTLSAATYLSCNFAGTSDYGWIDSDTTFDINYSFIGADGYTVTNSNPTSYGLLETITFTTPTIDVATPQFAGWFAEINDEEPLFDLNKQIFSITGAELLALYNGNATLYGKWASESHTITFDTTTSGNGNINASDISIPSFDVEAGTAFNPYSNIQISNIVNIYQDDITINRYFDGWYTDSAFTNKVSETDGLTVSSNVTLYAKWSTKASVSFSIPSNGGSYSIDTIYLVPGTSFNPYVYDTQHEAYDNDYNFQYYFAGWYVGDNKVSEAYQAITTDTTFTAKWLTKVKVIFHVAESYGIESPYAWFIPNSTINPYAIDTGLSAMGSDYTFAYYFDSWYFDESLTNKIDGNITISASGEMTIYSLWLAKNVVNITLTTKNISNDTITVSAAGISVSCSKNATTTIYVMDGTTIDSYVACTGLSFTLFGYGYVGGANVSIAIGNETLASDSSDRASSVANAMAKAEASITITEDCTITISAKGS